MEEHLARTPEDGAFPGDAVSFSYTQLDPSHSMNPGSDMSGTPRPVKIRIPKAATSALRLGAAFTVGSPFSSPSARL